MARLGSSGVGFTQFYDRSGNSPGLSIHRLGDIKNKVVVVAVPLGSAINDEQTSTQQNNELPTALRCSSRLNRDMKAVWREDVTCC